MREPSRAELESAAVDLFGLLALPAKVLVITEGPEGIMASCTEEDPAEIRGLMYRAGTALPRGGFGQ